MCKYMYMDIYGEVSFNPRINLFISLVCIVQKSIKTN